jgi:hypothetical protein
LFCLIILSKATLPGPNSTLEGLFINDTLIGEGFKNGFVLLTFALLRLGLLAFTFTGINTVLTLTRKWSRATELLP